MASIFKITASAAVVATALYAAAGYLAVPTLVKSTLADTLGKQLGRSVTVTNVAFNPWTWEFTLEGLTVAGKNNNPPLPLARPLLRECVGPDARRACARH